VKWIAIVVGTVVVVGIVAAVIGSRLSKAHRASISGTFPVPADVIWATIINSEAFPTWRAGVTRVERLPDRNGFPVWVEHGRSGRLTLAVERMEAPLLLVARIADPNLPFGGTWTYELTRTPEGCRLTITEDGEIYNPLFRFMARYIFGYESTIAGYMASLGKHVAASRRRSDGL
jgi:uncharacterized protein YndB with AHSA1/START domain